MKLTFFNRGVSGTRRLLLIAALVTLSGCRAQPQAMSRPRMALRGAATQPLIATSQPSYSISEMRVQTTRATNYFYAETRTNLRDIGPAVDKAMAALNQAAVGGHVVIGGPPTFVYFGATEDPDKPFELQVGVPVSAGSSPWGDFKVRELAAFHSAAVVLTGPLSSISKAYDKLIPDMISAGLTPSTESREVYMFWEGPESINDMTLVEVGIR